MGNVSVFTVKRNSEISKKAKILSFCRVYNSIIEDYTYVGRNCNVLNATIGKFCSIAPNVKIGVGNHPIEMISTSPVFHSKKNILKKSFANFKMNKEKEIIIGNDVWIGTNVVIKNGVRIGNGAIIGAGSIVTKDVEEFSIVGGVPAKIIRYRFSEDERKLIGNSKWWEWSEEKINQNIEIFESIEKFKESKVLK